MIPNSKTYEKAIASVASDISTWKGSILITGASGLIGSCLTDVFLVANRVFHSQFEIFALGRNKDRMNKLFGSFPEIHFILQDVMDPLSVEGIDYIIHTASIADPKMYALYPVETMLTNFWGMRQVLEYGKHNNARILMTSSFEIYGKLDQDDYSENDYGILDLNLIRNCYPVSKRAAECLCRAFIDEYRIDCLIARLPSVYGPTMQENDSKAHAQFISSVLAGKDIILHSPGTQKRNYCYVLDIVSGLLYLLFHGKTGEIYNVANDSSVTTIAEVANILSDLSGSNIVFDYQNDLEKMGYSRPQNCILNTKKIHALGWQGRYGLREGLLETLTILREMKTNSIMDS